MCTIYEFVLSSVLKWHLCKFTLKKYLPDWKMFIIPAGVKKNVFGGDEPEEV